MIGNGKLQNTITGAYTPTFDKEPFFCQKGIDKRLKRGYTKQAVAAGRRGRPDNRNALKRTSKKCLTRPDESGKIYKSSRDGMAFEN